MDIPGKTIIFNKSARMKDVNKYRRLHEKVFGFEPNVMLVFTHFDEVCPYYFDVTNGVFLDEVVSVTKKYGLKIRPIINYCI